MSVYTDVQICIYCVMRVWINPNYFVLFVSIAGSLSIGMVQRYESPSGSGVGFLSENSQILTETTLRRSVFYITERDQFMLVEADSDVLSTSNFMTVLDIDRRYEIQLSCLV